MPSLRLSPAHSSRRIGAAVALGAIVALGTLTVAAAPATAATTEQNFSTAGLHTFTVPAGVESLTVEALGGSGFAYSYIEPVGRQGALVTATIPVTPGDVLTIAVGGNGGGYVDTFNGGTMGGGGATDIRQGAATLNDRLVVAGGGGAASGFDGTYGGAGGTPNGGDGSQASFCDRGAAGGGATQSAGGTAGTAACGAYLDPDGTNGTAGTFGVGGAGGVRPSGGNIGGGGGGGYFGGGGGGPYTGGGGGSSYAIPTATDVSMSNGTLGAAPYLTITYDLPPATEISASLSSDSIAADGTSSTTVTATVENEFGNPVAGDAVAFSSTDDDHVFSTVVDHGDGTYTSTLTASTLAGTSTITATDSSVTPALTSTVTLTQTAGTTAGISVDLDPAVIVADGASTTEVTASVQDEFGNLVVGDEVTLSSSDAGQVFSTVTDNGNGTFTATLTASTDAGSSTITAASESGPTGTADLTQTAGAASDIALELSESAIVADGTSSTTVTATIEDEFGNPVTGDVIEFSSTDDAHVFSTVTDDGNGSYSANLTASTLAGTSTITATNTSVTPALTEAVTLTQTPGATVLVDVALEEASLLADGAASTAVTATVEDAFGNAVAGDTIEFASTDAEHTFSAPVDNGDGTYTATVTASTVAGASTITATSATGPSGTVELTQTAGPADDVTVELGDNSLPADGASNTTVTVTVDDAFGNPVAGEAITLSSNDDLHAFSTVTDHGDGTYTATLTASTVAGTSTITAVTDDGPAGTATLTQTAGLATDLSLGLSEWSVVADGSSSIVVTARGTDQFGNAVAGDAIEFSTTDPGQTLSTVTDNGDGTYTATVTASTLAGASTITATNASVTPSLVATADLSQTAGPAANLTLELADAALTADGVSTTTLTVTVEDQFGNRVAGDDVDFASTDAGHEFSDATDHGDGTYTATLTASTVAGTSTITATDFSVEPSLAATAELSQSAGPAATVGVSLADASLVADGASTTTVTAAVGDEFGNPLAGQTLEFSSSDAGHQFSSVTDNGDGTYFATLTASTVAGSSTITATVVGTDLGASASAELVQTAVASDPDPDAGAPDPQAGSGEADSAPGELALTGWSHGGALSFAVAVIMIGFALMRGRRRTTA